MNLVIVESPAKAKTIEGFLGKDFVVKSSYGHVRDLAKKGLSIDIEKNFEPDYQVMPDKKKVIKELKDLTKKADAVWLATDEDREGEAISWHLAEVLGLDKQKTKRIVFHEITKPAITHAIENPRTINQDLVNAQQARRVLDRLVGFELSPILWRKVKPSLSAGRVQSVTVRLIVEREREIIHFKPESAFRVKAYFIHQGKNFSAELDKRFKTEDEAKAFLEKCKGAGFVIDSVEKKPGKRTPAAPFTTSSLQQEASRKLGFSVAQTMMVAQKLYEAGKITYMRTDSVNLSMTAINAAKDTILNQYGEEYVNPRKFSTKAASAQEAHEAIRPTYLDQQSIKGDRQETRLYDLIWKRTIASQMAEAKLEKTVIKVKAGNTGHHFVAQGEVIVFDGFLKVYIESTDEEPTEEAQGTLPKVSEGEELKTSGIEATERFTHHPPRYTEASLVKKLEELGIGRPSTYAPTISTVQKRGYVVKEERPGEERSYTVLALVNGEISKKVETEITGAEKNKLFPTDIGTVVNDFLVDHFARILDYNFTAKVEKEFDEIASGSEEWEEMIKRFYDPFHKGVEETMEQSDKATGERHLGEDPKSGNPVYAKIGRYGPMIQIGATESEEKPKFAKLRADQSIQTITLEEALDLFKLPRTVGEMEGKEVVAGIGRFGPYIRYNSKFYNIAGHDPMDISLEEATDVIKAKDEEERNRVIHSWEHEPKVEVLRGRYGPYISYGTSNYKIPKGEDPESLTLERCLEIISTSEPTGKGKRFRKKS